MLKSWLRLYHAIPTLTIPIEKPFENMVRKGENTGNQHFLLFSPCFLPFPFSFFSVTFILSSANAFNLDHSEILSFGKELSRVLIKSLVDQMDWCSLFTMFLQQLSQLSRRLDLLSVL